MEAASKLKLEAWLVEEEKKAEECLNFLRIRLGTFRAEKDPTFNFIEGWLAAVRSALRHERV
jgi:hypothetical protein